MLRRGPKFVIVIFIRVIKSRTMRGAELSHGWKGEQCFFKNHASRFVSYYEERNKQMTIKHNNLINRYYIKTVVFLW